MEQINRKITGAKTAMTQKPTREYCAMLIAEAQEMVKEYLLVTTGQKSMSQEEKDKWNERKRFVHEEIGRVRKLL
jgi:hypothetical protein